MDMEADDRERSETANQSSDSLYRTLFEALDDGFCTIEVLFDADGKAFDYRFLQFNPAFEQQTGLADAIGRTIRELAPAHEQYWFDIYGKIALTGVPARFEHQADALGRWYEVYAFRIGRPQDRQVAIMFRDIKEKKQAEEALRKSEERTRALVNASSDVVYRVSPDWQEMRQLDGRGFLSDVERPSVRWMDEFIFPEDHADIRAAIEQAIRERRPYELEHRVRQANGEAGWTFSRAIPVFDEAGNIVEWFGMAADVTERVMARERQQLLNGELGHRLKNVLALVQSIAGQTFRQVDNVAEAAEIFGDRIVSLGHATDILTETAWADARLNDVVRAGLTSVGDFGSRIRTAGPIVDLGPQQALMLTLALHELSTNSLKYGALSNDSGSVSLTWEIASSADGRPQFHLRWHETGGPAVNPPKREGFGSRMIARSLPASFHGKAILG